MAGGAARGGDGHQRRRADAPRRSSCGAATVRNPKAWMPHRARSEAALTILRDLYEGLDRHRRRRNAGVGRRRSLRHLARRQRPIDSICAPAPAGRTATPVVAEDFTAAWRRLVDPHTGAQYAGIYSRRCAARPRSRAAARPPATLAVQAPDPATLIVELAHPTAYFLSVLAHPATFPIHRALAGRARTRLRQTGRDGVERRLRLDPLGFRLALGGAAQSALLERCSHAPRGGRVLLLCRARHGTSRPSAAVELDITATIPAAQVGLGPRRTSAASCTSLRSSRSITWASI